MASYKTLGIVIKRRNIGEADRLLTVMTVKHGKMTAVAKGARRPLSKLGSFLEPFNLVNFVMAEGRNIDTVTEAVVEKYYQNIGSDLGKMTRASRIAELLDVLTNDKEEHPKIFRLFDNCLDHLDKTGSHWVDLYFFVNALSNLGYCPELYECVSCRGKIAKEYIAWNNEHGGVVCIDCRKDESQIDPEVVKILRLFLQKESRVINQLTMDEHLARKVEETLIGFISHINQKELRCDKFWKSIRGEGLQE